MVRLMFRKEERAPMVGLVLSPHEDPRKRRRSKISEEHARLYHAGWLALQEKKGNARMWSLDQGRVLLLIDVDAVQRDLNERKSRDSRGEADGDRTASPVCTGSPSGGPSGIARAIEKTLKNRFNAKSIPEASPIARALCSMGYAVVKHNKADSAARTRDGVEYRVVHKPNDESFCKSLSTKDIILGSTTINSCEIDSREQPAPAATPTPASYASPEPIATTSPAAYPGLEPTATPSPAAYPSLGPSAMSSPTAFTSLEPGATPSLMALEPAAASSPVAYTSPEPFATSPMAFTSPEPIATPAPMAPTSPEPGATSSPEASPSIAPSPWQATADALPEEGLLIPMDLQSTYDPWDPDEPTSGPAAC
eukprot:m51a1_g12668 hypothetical protein (366) ;mRNA; r:57-1377